MSSDPAPQIATTGGAGTATESTSRSWPWCAPALLVLAHGLFNFLLTPVGTSPPEYPKTAVALVVGVMLLQPVLFGMWASLISRPFYQRFLAGAAATVLVAFMENSGRIKADALIDASYTAVLMAFFTATTLLLLPVRHVGGRRIDRRLNAGMKPVERGRQFGIKHLLIGTFLVAALLGLLRYLAGLSGSSAALELLQASIFFALLLPPLVVPWATLAYRPDQKRRAQTALGISIVASGVCLAILSTMPRTLTPGDTVQFLAIAQVGACLGGFITALVLRWSGYRIMQKVCGHCP